MAAVFFEELSAVFECGATKSCPVVVCGDISVHVDQSDDPHAVRLIQSFDCVQHVVEPTHVASHTLDLVITTTDTVIAHLCEGALIYIDNLSAHGKLFSRLQMVVKNHPKWKLSFSISFGAAKKKN